MSEQASGPRRHERFDEFCDVIAAVCRDAKGWYCRLVVDQNAFLCVLGEPHGVRLETSLSFSNNLRIVTRTPSRARHRAGLAAFLLSSKVRGDWRNGDQIVDAVHLRNIVSQLVANSRICAGVGAAYDALATDCVAVGNYAWASDCESLVTGNSNRLRCNACQRANARGRMSARRSSDASATSSSLSSSSTSSSIITRSSDRKRRSDSEPSATVIDDVPVPRTSDFDDLVQQVCTLEIESDDTLSLAEALFIRMANHISLERFSVRGVTVPKVLLSACVSLLSITSVSHYERVRSLLGCLHLPSVCTVRSAGARAYANNHCDEFCEHLRIVIDRHGANQPAMLRDNNDVDVELTSRRNAALRRLMSIMVGFGDDSVIRDCYVVCRTDDGKVHGQAELLFASAFVRDSQLVGTAAPALGRKHLVVWLRSPFYNFISGGAYIAVAEPESAHGALWSQVRWQVGASLVLNDVDMIAFGGDAHRAQQRSAKDVFAVFGQPNTQESISSFRPRGDHLTPIPISDFTHILKRLYGHMDVPCTLTPPPAPDNVTEAEVVGLAMFKNVPKSSHHAVDLKIVQQAVYHPPKSAFEKMDAHHMLHRFNARALAAIVQLHSTQNTDCRAKYKATFDYVQICTSLAELTHRKAPFTSSKWPADLLVLQNARAFFDSAIRSWSKMSQNTRFHPTPSLFEDVVFCIDQYVQLVSALFAEHASVLAEFGLAATVIECKICPLALLQGALERFFGTQRGGQAGAAVSALAASTAMTKENLKMSDRNISNYKMERQRAVVSKRRDVQGAIHRSSSRQGAPTDDDSDDNDNDNDDYDDDDDHLFD
jgi:hypothetical protein